MSAIQASIFLVGAGRMGGALLRCWLECGADPARIAVQEPNPSPDLLRLLGEKGIANRPQSAPDVLVLAVKPQLMASALEALRCPIGPNTAVMSIAAGTLVSTIAHSFPPETAIVRAMPNLPAEVGRGITALYANGAADAAHRERCEALMQAAGETAWIDREDLMDAVTGVSGSGPAYVFYLVECLAHAARRQGMPNDLAVRFARATVVGAGELLRLSPLSADALRHNVTSPAGTTAAGLAVLMRDGGLEPLIDETVAAATHRSQELAR